MVKMFATSASSVTRAVAFLLPLVVACTTRTAEPPPETERALMESHAYTGLSGLTLDDQGRLWAVPERTPALLRLDRADGRLSVAEALAIEGFPEGVDLESLAFAKGKFYVGTESLESGREEDPIVVIEPSDDGRAKVVGTLAFPYAQWGTTGSRNHGIEGVCVAGNKLVASAELGLGTTERRAPVGVFDLESGQLERAWRVPLTSETGKLSALHCNADGAVIDVRAVERHYGVARVVVARLDPGAATVTTRVLADLSTRLDPLPNIEGITLDAEGRVYIITDNQGRTASGPTVLFSGLEGKGLFRADGD